VERILADHPLAGGVDDDRRPIQKFVALFPWQRLDRTAEILRDLLCALECAIHEADLFCTRLRKGVANRTRAAPRADHDTGPGVSVPTRLLLPDAVDESVTVVVGARERPIGPDHDATDGADALRDRVDFIDPLHRLLLVRKSEIATGESERM